MTAAAGEEGVIPVVSISDEIMDKGKVVNLVFDLSIVKWRPHISCHGKLVMVSFGRDCEIRIQFNLDSSTKEEEMIIGRN